MKMKQIFLPISLLAAFLFPLLQVQAQNVFPATGNAGIGTSSPRHDLDVQPSNTAMTGDSVDISELGLSLHRTQDVSTESGVGIGFGISSGTENTGGAILFERTGSFSAGKLHFATKSSNGLGEDIPINMTLDEDGQLGIGTMSPDKRFVVDGSTSTFKASPNQNVFRNTSIGAWLNGKAGIGPQIRFQGSGGNGGFIDIGKDGDGDFVIERFDAIQFSVEANGNVGIGTSSAQNKLDVCGTIRAMEVKVETGWCDYVFEKDYKLTSLEDVKAHIAEKGHLHKTPSAAQVEAEGVKLAATTVQQQEKIEEVFLHLIEMNERLKAMELENAELKARLSEKK